MIYRHYIDPEIEPGTAALLSNMVFKQSPG
jgi:hypothetical protein